MVTESWVVGEVSKIVPDAIVEATDLHGTGDHFHVRIISPTYEGLRPLQRQMPILRHFKQYLESNLVHALDLKCMTPEQAKNAGSTTFDPHSGKQEFFGVHVRREDRT